MIKKIFVLVSGVTFGFILFLLFAAYWLGAFNSVELTREQRGPYRIVYLRNTGAYTGVAEKILQVKGLLTDAGPRSEVVSEEQLHVPCGIYYDDPDKVAEAKLRSKGGYVVKGEVEVEPPLKIENIPRREVLVAQFSGHPSLARLKVYPAMMRWMEEHGVEPALPMVEFYYDNNMECEIPISSPGEEELQ